MDAAAELPRLDRALPEVPVEARRHGNRLAGAARAEVHLVEGRADVGLGHVAEAPLPDPLAQQAHVLAGVALVAHLRGDLLRLGQLAELAGLVDIVAQRLLAVDGQPGVQGADAGGEVIVVGRGNPNGVEMFLLVEELAVVAIDLRVGEPALDRS